MTEKLDDTSQASTAQVLSALKTTGVWQEQVYKEIHADPELSFQETNTAALAASKLKEFGL